MKHIRQPKRTRKTALHKRSFEKHGHLFNQSVRLKRFLKCRSVASGSRFLAEQGAHIDTTSPAGKLVFGIFAALAEFESEFIRERTMAGLQAARARGRKGGRKFALSKSQERIAQIAMTNRDSSVAELCAELGINRVTLYRYVDPKGELRVYGKRVLNP